MSGLAPAVRCGTVIEVVFPLSECRPRFTVLRLSKEDVLLQSERGRISVMPIAELRQRLSQGEARAVAA